eukprot:g8293.t1
MDDYGGPKDYGEYCHFWELAFPGTNDDCYTWKKDDPTYMDDAPNCNGITLHKSGSLGGTYAGLSMFTGWFFASFVSGIIQNKRGVAQIEAIRQALQYISDSS